MEGETRGGNHIWEDAPCLPRAMASLLTTAGEPSPLLLPSPVLPDVPVLSQNPSAGGAGTRAMGGTAGGVFGAVKNNSLAWDPVAPKGQEPLLLCTHAGTLQQHLKARGQWPPHGLKDFSRTGLPCASALQKIALRMEQIFQGNEKR